MDLRNLPDNLTASERCDHRRELVAAESGVDLGLLTTSDDRIGLADEKNCEQMLGTVPVPIGYAGPLSVRFSSGETVSVHLPLATTEAALVASVNRGCKAVREAGVHVKSDYIGMTRSLAFRVPASQQQDFYAFIEGEQDNWRTIGEQTSEHLRLLSASFDQHEDVVFLTIACDTDEAMGMNMVTIAGQAIGEWIKERRPEALFVTVAGNVDSDKKPSMRTKELGRGYEVIAEAEISQAIISDVLKADAQTLLEVAHAKLEMGSAVAGALGKNLQAANIIAALYIATGQDPAHVVEGSLADTHVTMAEAASRPSLRMNVRCPAILVGIRGGGTNLPAQKQCLDLLLSNQTKLHRSRQLAESIGAAVLAGELSLLAAQATHHLAKAHKSLSR